MKKNKIIFILLFLGISIAGIIYIIKINGSNLLETVLQNKCSEKSYCQKLTYIKFKDISEYHTFIIYKQNDNGYLAVLNNVYKQTAFSTPTDCYMGGCNDGTEIYTSNNNNIGTLLNHDFLNILSNYRKYLNFASWSVGSIDKNQTGNAYVGLVSFEDWENMKKNNIFNQNVSESYWLGNATNDSPYRIYIVKETELLIDAPNIPKAFARPVIEMKKNIKISGGNGTKEDPFIIN